MANSETYKQKFKRRIQAFSHYTVLKHDYGIHIAERPYLENGEWVVDWGAPKEQFLNSKRLVIKVSKRA